MEGDHRGSRILEEVSVTCPVWMTDAGIARERGTPHDWQSHYPTCCHQLCSLRCFSCFIAGLETEDCQRNDFLLPVGFFLFRMFYKLVSWYAAQRKSWLRTPPVSTPVSCSMRHRVSISMPGSFLTLDAKFRTMLGTITQFTNNVSKKIRFEIRLAFNNPSIEQLVCKLVRFVEDSMDQICQY